MERGQLLFANDHSLSEVNTEVSRAESNLISEDSWAASNRSLAERNWTHFVSFDESENQKLICLLSAQNKKHLLLLAC